MDKKRSFKLINLFITVLSLISYSLCSDSSSTYLDGNYSGYSQATYINEPYWGHARINVTGGSFTSIEFMIRDSSFHENVDSMYGIVNFPGQPDYLDQCVNDGHGIVEYPKRLLKSQNLSNVDAITGATWSYKIFIASVKAALISGAIPNSIYKKFNTGTTITESVNTHYFGKTIEYVLPERSFVKLTIYNNQGRLIRILQQGIQETGLHSIVLNNCPAPGVYYYTLQTDDKMVCRKILQFRK
jgi:major membrane immunogen (membrane-anchored lipoprotein)